VVNKTDAGWTVVSRESVPSLASPAGAGVLTALLLPAVQSAREAARRTQCANNLKLHGLAMHNYHDVYGSFPPPAITNEAGDPLLSWRVAILPFVGQQPLYEEFHLDEPWDSPHNRTLIERMPEVFACPSHPFDEPGRTTYRVAVGEETLFVEGSEGISLADVTDGSSFTLMVVESPEETVWTKPGGLEFSNRPEADLPPVGSDHPGGWQTLLGDGSVHFLSDTLDPELLNALFTRNGNERIDFNTLN